ncbi:MAG TPA: hypothetical protein VN695_00320 [Streptosporangiaceae bacterium]|nr:hypothetical protein [Streptosporangiaceae bacterium]
MGAVMIIIGTGAFAACLRSVLAGVRDVMINDGGSCGSGGPYVIAHQCSSGDIRLLLVGIVGGLLATAVYAAGTSTVSQPAARGSYGASRPWTPLSAGLIAWVAAFGTLGWNFLSLVINPPAGQARSAGYLISGIVFLALAVGGLVPLLSRLISDLRPGNGQPVAVGGVVQRPIVAAVIPPGLGTAPPTTFGGWSAGGPTAQAVTSALADAVPQPVRPSPLASLGIWLATTAVGAAIGVVLSSSLVSLLR